MQGDEVQLRQVRANSLNCFVLAETPDGLLDVFENGCHFEYSIGADDVAAERWNRWLECLLDCWFSLTDRMLDSELQNINLGYQDLAGGLNREIDVGSLEMSVASA